MSGKDIQTLGSVWRPMFLWATEVATLKDIDSKPLYKIALGFLVETVLLKLSFCCELPSFISFRAMALNPLNNDCKSDCKSLPVVYLSYGKLLGL